MGNIGLVDDGEIARQKRGGLAGADTEFRREAGMPPQRLNCESLPGQQAAVGHRGGRRAEDGRVPEADTQDQRVRPRFRGRTR